MEMYVIKLPAEFKNFVGFCHKISEYGKFFINVDGVILALKTDKNLPNFEDSNILVKKVENYEKDLCSDFAKKWALQQLVEDEQENAKTEIQNRINVMYDILSTANKIAQGGEINGKKESCKPQSQQN